MAAKREIKTRATGKDPLDLIAGVKSEVERNDSREILAMMQDLTGEPPKTWGPSIVGSGSYRYEYASGHSGEMCLTGFSPRSNALVLYLGPGVENAKPRAKLGKHKTGKGCLYVNKLDDVDRKVLRELIEYSVAELCKRRTARSRVRREHRQGSPASAGGAVGLRAGIVTPRLPAARPAAHPGTARRVP